MSKNSDEIFCDSYGKVIKKKAMICVHCGVSKNNNSESKIILFLLCLFLGWLGIHRLYIKKIGTGLLYMFTGGLLGIGVFIDLISICIGSFYTRN
ncbi:TM2 domain-containing protein (plasmid) [Borrelia coriaceae]|uniref:TM2 domain-containing protein n=1 Tax=Borrelia coriaceae ATCC 43381 TaxID=1408429 RepID=W5SXI1_9SPIR|nr:TM2 domain-containing protein [Borrelia coriaceae]AHH11602.1 Hypothetical protein BCO_0900112 [Borrelia coriaceae ATCC 43381]UPA17254.1 TM2 domain-containing protein [Borrelia coriaceae]